MNEQPVKASIGNGQYIHFASSTDALIFAASTGFENFAKCWAQLYPDSPNPKHRDFHSYTTKDRQARLPTILKETKLSNGQTLAEALRKKVKNQ